ncbi:MAG: hypothetical protein ACK4RZ_06440 [Paracoccaceae bacterium]
MQSIVRARIIAPAIAAATAGLALVVGEGIPGDLAVFAKTLAPILFGAALSQWLLFPLFARKPGALGWMLDGLAFLSVIALSGLFAGTLLMPGIGAVLGPLVALSLPARSLLTALTYLAGATSVIALIRKTKGLL